MGGGKTNLTIMNALTVMSAEDQVVIPKGVRDDLGYGTGQPFEVVKMGDSVLLRPERKKSGRSFDEIVAGVQAPIKYDGPPVTIEEMNETIAEGWRRAAKDSDR